MGDRKARYVVSTLPCDGRHFLIQGRWPACRKSTLEDSCPDGTAEQRLDLDTHRYRTSHLVFGMLALLIFCFTTNATIFSQGLYIVCTYLVVHGSKAGFVLRIYTAPISPLYLHSSIRDRGHLRLK